jgi:Leucine-rich repeat (LRR) protein
MKFSLIILFLSSLLLAQRSMQSNGDTSDMNCVFKGCSCGSDAEAEINSNEDDDTISPYSITYDIICKHTRPLNAFPERDHSKRYSHQINTLDIIGNEITEIPDDRFSGLDIATADFSRNKISHTSPNAFRGIRKLDVLDLSNNELESLSEETFRPIQSSLIVLKLIHNKLGFTPSRDELSSTFESFKNLKSLSLQSNHIKNLFDLSRMSKLEELSLDSNQIELLTDPDTNESLLPSTLIDLTLENNRLKHLDEKMFANLKNLKYLNLQSNQISSISDSAFAHSTRLISINLAKNYLKHIPSKSFFTLNNLERLDLSAQSQMIKRIDAYAFDRQSSTHPIRKIDLSKNNIAEIDNKAFCSLDQSSPFVSIKEIDLALNALTQIQSCVFWQMYKGISKFNLHQKHNVQMQRFDRARVSFKVSHFDKLGPKLKCDCEIARTAQLLDLDGECENTVGVSVKLTEFKCSGDSQITSHQVDEQCAAMSIYNCEAIDEKSSTSKSEIDLEVQNTNSNNNENKGDKEDGEDNSASNNNSNNQQPNEILNTIVSNKPEPKPVVENINNNNNNQQSHNDKQSAGSATKFPNKLENNSNSASSTRNFSSVFALSVIMISTGKFVFTWF